MLIVRYSSLMRKKQSTRVLNVFHQYQKEKEQGKSRANLFSKLWLKASRFYDWKYKDTETYYNYHDDLLSGLQTDVSSSNIKGLSDMRENELIYTVLLINLNLQKNNTNQQNVNYKSFNNFKNKKCSYHAS